MVLKSKAKSISRSVIGKRSRSRGHAYERKIINELKILSGDNDLVSSRSESKRMDDMKIDMVDPNKVFPCYFQMKSTQNVPQIKTINEEVGKKDLPLCILWSAQEARESKQVCVGEYAIIPKDFLYLLFKYYFICKTKKQL